MARVAVVSGGTRGIGAAIASALKAAGYDVAANYAGNDQAASAFKAETGIAVFKWDVGDGEACAAGLAKVEAELGAIDILVNNAGIGMVRQITEVSEEDWDHCIDTNLKGPFFGSKHAIRHMRQTGGGAIVNTASNAGLLPRAHDPVYSISKMALVALTKSLALCHARDNIRVNAVCPGPVGETGMMNADIAAAADPAAAVNSFIAASPLASALGRMIHPEEVALAILYLVSDEAAMVTGTAIAIDGGKSLGVPPAAASQ